MAGAVIEGEDAPCHEAVRPELASMRVAGEVEVHAAGRCLLDAQRLVLHRDREGVKLRLRKLGMRGDPIVLQADERDAGRQMHRATAQAAHAAPLQPVLFLIEIQPVRVVVAEDRKDAPRRL